MKRRNFFEFFGAGALSPGLFSFEEKREASESLFPGKKLGVKRIIGSMDPRIELNFRHLAWNFSRIKNLVKVKVMAVVKANAYGHGLVEVCGCLEKMGVDWLMVGKLEEALQLREAGIRTPILNYGPFSREDVAEIIDWEIGQTVYSEEVRYIQERAQKTGKKAGVHVEVDTGMGRVGVPVEKSLPLLEKISQLSRVKMEGLSTTLTEDLEFDKEQLQRFLAISEKASQRGIEVGLRHVASSAGILEGQEFFLDMVRPGIMLYGYYPSPEAQKEDRLGLRPVLKLKAKVVDIRDLSPGDTISYHRIFKAKEKMRAATLGIGYSDGFMPQLGGKGEVIIKEKKFLLLPAITANHTMVDLINDPEIQVGDEAILIDNEKQGTLTADVLSEQSGLSVYKMLIGLSPFLPRELVRLKV